MVSRSIQDFRPRASIYGLGSQDYTGRYYGINLG